MPDIDFSKLGVSNSEVNAGDLIITETEGVFMITNTGDNGLKLVCLESGNRWNDDAFSRSGTTIKEVERITGLSIKKHIEQHKYKVTLSEK